MLILWFPLFVDFKYTVLHKYKYLAGIGVLRGFHEGMLRGGVILVDCWHSDLGTRIVP